MARLFSYLMKGVNIMEKRKDKNRTFRTGESKRKDGRYVFKYQENGKSKYIYSWRLTEADPVPKGKHFCRPLRELEDDLKRDQLDGINSSGKKMLLWQLYEKHTALKPNVRKSTVDGRNQLLELLKSDNLGLMSIDKIKPSDTKEWVIRMSKKYAFQTIKNYKRSLTACFYTAINDDLVRKNPFTWDLKDVLEDDTEAKVPLTKEQSDALLAFLHKDSVYHRYYNAIVVLLNTGLRISELCGLTVSDIDFEKGFIRVNHQINYNKGKYSISEPKTESGVRDIPMTDTVKQALQSEIQSRTKIKSIKVDGYTDFVFLNKKGLPMYAVAYSATFPHMVKKYNKYHTEKLPAFTPHTLRHTFCTTMANKKMTPNTLQYVMGHKNITMTLGYYAHGTAQSAMAEMLSISA